MSQTSPTPSTAGKWSIARLVASAGTARGVGTGASPQPARSLAIEQAVAEVLEERKLMSSVTFADGVLTIDGAGDARLDTAVTYAKRADKITVASTNTSPRRQAFPRIEVREIRVLGTDGDAGNDLLTGGAGDDAVDGGAGRD